MSERPQATKGEARIYVRNVLSAAGGYGMTRPKLELEVSAQADPDEVREEQLVEAIEFGLAQGWIRSEIDQVTEQWRYYITSAGVAAGKVR